MLSYFINSKTASIELPEEINFKSETHGNRIAALLGQTGNVKDFSFSPDKKSVIITFNEDVDKFAGTRLMQETSPGKLEPVPGFEEVYPAEVEKYKKEEGIGDLEERYLSTVRPEKDELPAGEEEAIQKRLDFLNTMKGKDISFATNKKTEEVYLITKSKTDDKGNKLYVLADSDGNEVDVDYDILKKYYFVSKRPKLQPEEEFGKSMSREDAPAMSEIESEEEEDLGEEYYDQIPLNMEYEKLLNSPDFDIELFEDMLTDLITKINDYQKKNNKKLSADEKKTVIRKYVEKKGLNGDSFLTWLKVRNINPEFFKKWLFEKSATIRLSYNGLIKFGFDQSVADDARAMKIGEVASIVDKQTGDYIFVKRIQFKNRDAYVLFDGFDKKAINSTTVENQPEGTEGDYFNQTTGTISTFSTAVNENTGEKFVHNVDTNEVFPLENLPDKDSLIGISNAFTKDEILKLAEILEITI